MDRRNHQTDEGGKEVVQSCISLGKETGLEKTENKSY